MIGPGSVCRINWIMNSLSSLSCSADTTWTTYKRDACDSTSIFLNAGTITPRPNINIAKGTLSHLFNKQVFREYVSISNCLITKYVFTDQGETP